MKSRSIIFISFLFSIPLFGGSFFTLAEQGALEDLTITLCLNGQGPISCQKYKISALNLQILTKILGKRYPEVGIKLNDSGYELFGCTSIKNGYCLFSVGDDLSCNIVISPKNYEMVLVGNPNNAADITGFGAVDHSFSIGKYEVTIAQYATFLNAVAKTDPYFLYNPKMATDLNSAGIQREGDVGNYNYVVIDNGGISANRPITYISWFSAARFANWMANGQPEGDPDAMATENGAYDLNGAVSGVAIAKNSINPNTGKPPSYYIPTQDEWYKAAYYDPTLAEGEGGYYLYGTKSDDSPQNGNSKEDNGANGFTGGVFCVTQSSDYLTDQNYLTDVGTFVYSSSYYGLFDASGGVWEWNDLDGEAVSYRGIRGGYWFGGLTPMQSLMYATLAASNVDNGIGFRLASPSE